LQRTAGSVWAALAKPRRPPDSEFHTDPLTAGDYEITAGRINESDDPYVSSIRMGDEDVLAKGLRFVPYRLPILA